MKSVVVGSIAMLSLMTFGGADKAADALPRPEYPRPQFVREAWINLNGKWSFEFDFGQSGTHEGRMLQKSKGFSKSITVPFCPESSLSGVGYKDFIPALWYHRKIQIPANWRDKRVYINFGGVDYEAEIYVDSVSVGYHAGGSSSFSVDLTRYVKAGSTHDLVVRVKDDILGGDQPGGKQSWRFKSYACSYTRTTGIWQTVWLEAVDGSGLASCRIVPDYDNSAFVFTPSFLSDKAKRLKITVKTADGKMAGGVDVVAASGIAVKVPLSEFRPWAPGSAHLYDIVYEVYNAKGDVVDVVKSYAGLRKISIEDGRICLNNKPVYLRFVLDQGFYPDGIWTAPSDAALKRDIELSMAAGFNGARLHQKVFEERFHYWADKLGYLTWAEMSSWGAEPNNIKAARNFIPEWCEVVRRDLNHPSIIAWTPFNETWRKENILEHQRTQNDVYDLTKALDPTRPINSSSGEIHAKTDLWTIHNYYRAPKLKEIDTPDGTVWTRDKSYDKIPYARYDGQPYLIDEFGGLGWIGPDRKKAADNTWGYGNSIKTEEEFFDILKKEVDVILESKNICGYCYTQLTDVEQEQNGVYYYDRVKKFNTEKFKAIFGVDPKREPWTK
jgi:beta-galactosidase/beta-glucuronidase